MIFKCLDFLLSSSVYPFDCLFFLYNVKKKKEEKKDEERK